MRKIKHSKYIPTRPKRGTMASGLETDTLVMVDENFLTPSHMLPGLQTIQAVASLTN